jgi:TonB-linked SusC/RagA family outer membrane protein
MKCLRLQVRICLVLILGLCLSEAFAQGTVRGKVTSKADGMPLPGVNVLLKGKASGTTTDVDGRFNLIDVSAGEILTFSYIGYAVQEVVVTTQTEMNISLAEDITSLNEVVVTALGISKESRKVGYAVSTVNGDQLNRARETNVALSLAGQVTGLTVRGSSGGPGGTAQLLLRGMPSMNSGGSPLYVINGIPMDNTQRGGAGEWGGGDNGDGIGNLNPDDIETMTVLKGQSASALYGARASNGVILITTKKGKKNDFTVEYNTNYMTDHAMNLTDFQYEYGQGIGGAKPTDAASAQATSRLSWGAKLDGSQVPQFDGKSYAYSAQRDNIKNFYRTGSTFINTFAVSKGTESGSFRLSASTMANNSMVPNSGLDRKTINFSVDQKITDKLSVTAVANYIDEQSTNRSFLSDGPLNANNGLFLATNIDQRILAPGFDASKNGNEVRWGDDEYVTNPYFVTSQFRNDVGRKRLITSLMTRYNITSWLYAQGRVGYDSRNDRTFGVTPWGTAYLTNSTGSGSLGQSQTQTYELNLEGIIGANRKITSDLTIDALIGGNIRKNESESLSIGGSLFKLPYLYSFSNLANPTGNGFGYNKSAVNSGFYSIDISYKNFLTLTTTGRYDDYSKLYSSINPGKVTGVFTPSVSASFLFTELKDMGKLSFGKIRASLAQTSGEPRDSYQTALYYSQSRPFRGLPVGNFPSSAPNSTLSPFVVTELEIGTELKFFQNRLGFDISWYNRETKNEIMQSNSTTASGFSQILVGTGSTRNTGLEIQIKGVIVKSSDFEWSATLNYTNVKNTIVSTDPDGSKLSIGTNRAVLGNAFTAFVPGLSGPQIMAYDYKRLNGQIVVDTDGTPKRGELIPMGSVLPTNFGGLLNQLTYKGINFSFLIDYNFGNKVLSATEHYSLTRGLNKQTLEGRSGITTGVTENGAANTVQATAQNYYTAVARQTTSSNVVDGDFIKLRQVTLGYLVPVSKLGKLPFQSIQISFVARNLAVLMRKADNIDPESQFGSSINYYGIEGTGLPSARSYGFNVNFKFK